MSNSIIVNPDKFKKNVFPKSKQDTYRIPISLKDHCIASQKTVKLMRIRIDKRLSFENHVGGLCKTAASQLSAFKRLHQYITNEKTSKTLVQSFVLSHFNYCPLLYFTATKWLQKIEKILERALSYITDDHKTSHEMIMMITETTTMRAERMQLLWVRSTRPFQS